jgi:hypothetical protein
VDADLGRPRRRRPLHQVTEAYRAKYADQPSLVAMFLGPPGTEATLRVDQS